MLIKNVSVRTKKNHVETEVFLDAYCADCGCYLAQSVILSSDPGIIACEMTAGVPGEKVLTCADAVPAIVSTKENPVSYDLVTKLFDAKDSLIDENRCNFQFTLPYDASDSGRKSNGTLVSKIKEIFAGK